MHLLRGKPVRMEPRSTYMDIPERWLTPTVLGCAPCALIFDLGRAAWAGSSKAADAAPEWGSRIAVGHLSPLAQRGYRGLFRYRRLLGLTLFLYVSLHLLLFAQVYVGWSGDLLIEELNERPYVMVGFAAWCALIPLAFTSTDMARRRLGRRWRQLHRLVYPATILAWLHLLWLARSDVGEALTYGALFGLMLGWRVRRRLLKAR